ncbi:MAG: hypothetical protein ABIW80_02230, partial [Lapillicoccus sp.]
QAMDWLGVRGENDHAHFFELGVVLDVLQHIPAAHVGQADFPPSDLADIGGVSADHLDERTPLWFYILREAQVTAGGEHLGAVGGRIVGEVIIGLIQGDSQSYLTQDPEWTPTYGVGGTFGITDLLTKAGAVGTL